MDRQSLASPLPRAGCGLARVPEWGGEGVGSSGVVVVVVVVRWWWWHGGREGRGR